MQNLAVEPKYSIYYPHMQHVLCVVCSVDVFTLFSRIFTGEGTIGYMGCDSTEHRGQRLMGLEGLVLMFCTVKESLKVDGNEKRGGSGRRQ